MNRCRIFLLVATAIIIYSTCQAGAGDVRKITPRTLKDKIAGGRTGKMIGVTYGAPTEFRAQGKMFDDSVSWLPHWKFPFQMLCLTVTYLGSIKNHGRFQGTGKFIRTINSYYFYNNQEHENITIWHVNGLGDTQHQVKLVVKGEKKPESLGTRIYLTRATVYKTAPKKSSSFNFTFEKK